MVGFHEKKLNINFDKNYSYQQKLIGKNVVNGWVNFIFSPWKHRTWFQWIICQNITHWKWSIFHNTHWLFQLAYSCSFNCRYNVKVSMKRGRLWYFVYSRPNIVRLVFIMYMRKNKMMVLHHSEHTSCLI